MLHRASLRHFLHFPKSEVIFGDGFHVLTGQTGSGKSVFLKSLAWLVGGKLSAEQAASLTPCELEAHFVVSKNHPVLTILEQHRLIALESFSEADEHSVVILRRQATASSRAIQWINGKSVSLRVLQEISSQLIEITMQHASLQLSEPIFVKRLFEKNFPPSDVPIRKKYQEFYGRCQHSWNQLRLNLEMYRVQQSKCAAQDHLFQPIQALKPGLEDYQSLFEKLRVVTHTKEVHGLLEHLRSCLEGESKLLQNLKASKRQLQKFNDKSLEVVQEKLDQFLKNYEEFAFSLGSFSEFSEWNPREYEAHSQRLAEYQRLMRVLGVSSIEVLLEQYESMLKERKWCDDFLWSLQNEYKNLYQDTTTLYETGVLLLQKQKLHTQDVLEQINKDLLSLNVKGTLQIQWQVVRAGHSALDFKEAGLTSGELQKWENLWNIWRQCALEGLEVPALKLDSILPMEDQEASRSSIDEIASGGELSRVLLCVALACSQPQTTLFFDEVDAGLSGSIADRVGALLSRAGKSQQVFCISHLPQVAVYADRHYLMASSGVDFLDGEGSLREVAWLLSGQQLTKASLANARDLKIQRNFDL